MADRIKDLGHATAEAARKYATRQAEAGNRYVDVLQKFGVGKTTVDPGKIKDIQIVRTVTGGTTMYQA